MYQPNDIMPMEAIAKNCKEIQSFLQSHYEADIGNACVERLQGAEGYMALTGKMLADAKHHHATLLENSIIRAIEKANAPKMPISTLNKYIDSLTRDYSYLVDLTERQNRACTHACENLRTIISKLKAEMQLAGYVPH